jgi:hypothetical protein
VRGRLASVGYRIVGTPPARDAPKKERLLWLRRYYLRMLLLALPAYVLAVIFLSTPWIWIVLGVGILLWVQGFASLSFQIRRESRRAATPSSHSAG